MGGQFKETVPKAEPLHESTTTWDVRVGGREYRVYYYGKALPEKDLARVLSSRKPEDIRNTRIVAVLPSRFLSTQGKGETEVEVSPAAREHVAGWLLKNLPASGTRKYGEAVAHSSVEVREPAPAVAKRGGAMVPHKVAPTEKEKIAEGRVTLGEGENRQTFRISWTKPPLEGEKFMDFYRRGNVAIYKPSVDAGGNLAWAKMSPREVEAAFKKSGEVRIARETGPKTEPLEERVEPKKAPEIAAPELVIRVPGRKARKKEG